MKDITPKPSQMPMPMAMPTQPQPQPPMQALPSGAPPLTGQAPVPEQVPSPALTVHGGTDAGPPVTCDFSTNAHPLGPPPIVLDAVLAADRQRYPDPAYTALRQHLAAWHGVESPRVVPTAGGAEAIRRITLAAMLAGVRRVCVPQPGFGDYAAAAQALGLTVVPCEDVAAMAAAMDVPCLVWICDPCNPTGHTLDAPQWQALEQARQRSGSRLVVDQAYEPLRLHGASALPPALADQVWRLICPNKALGLTGVRAAYLLAPAHDDWRDRVAALAASWVLSAEGEALLMAWAQTEVQEELADSHALLSEWMHEQQRRLVPWGFQMLPGSVTNFWMAQLPDLGADSELDPELDLDLDLGATRRAVAPLQPLPPVQSMPARPATTTSHSPGDVSGAEHLAPVGPLGGGSAGGGSVGSSQRPVLPSLHHMPPTTPAALLTALRHHGIKLRDATSFGHPGWVRMSVQTPASQMALLTALHQVLGPHPVARPRALPPSLKRPADSHKDPT